jgi:hypothetical protein
MTLQRRIDQLQKLAQARPAATAPALHLLTPEYLAGLNDDELGRVHAETMAIMPDSNPERALVLARALPRLPDDALEDLHAGVILGSLSRTEADRLTRDAIVTHAPDLVREWDRVA